MLKLSILCTRFESIIVVVFIGAVKIYVVAVEAPRIKERHDETQFTTQNGGRTCLGLSYFVL
jgi:hypothetical protein